MEDTVDFARLKKKYKTKRKLSDGRFSAVHEMCSEDNKLQVLKIIKPSRNLNEAVYERDLLQDLHHENVVQFVRSDSERGKTLVMVLEYCDMETLNDHVVDLVKNRLILSRKERLSFMKDIAEGVRYLLNNNIMHLNIHAKNVLLNKQGKNRLVCKLSGFRLARRFGEMEINLSCREHGSSGQEDANCFCPPEYQNGHMTQKSDIFSLGVMFYALHRLQTEDGNVVAYFHRRRIAELQEGMMTPETLFQEVQDRTIESILWKTFTAKSEDRPKAADICSSLPAEAVTSRFSRKYFLYLGCVGLGFIIGVLSSRGIKLLKPKS